MATLGLCHCCRQSVSSEAEACPHCGQPSPYYPTDRPILENGSIHRAVVMTNIFTRGNDDSGRLGLSFAGGQRGWMRYSVSNDYFRHLVKSDTISVNILRYSRGEYECTAEWA